MSYKEWVDLYKSMHDLLKFSNWKITNKALYVAIDRAWDLFDRGKNLPKSGYLPTIYDNIVKNVQKLLPSDIDTQLMLCKEICQQSDNKMKESVKLHIISKNDAMKESVKLHIISKVDAILEQLTNFRIRVQELKKLRNFGIPVRKLAGLRSNVYLVQKKLFY